MDRDGPRGNASVAPETESDRGGLRPGTLRSRERGREGPPGRASGRNQPHPHRGHHVCLPTARQSISDVRSPQLVYSGPRGLPQGWTTIQAASTTDTSESEEGAGPGQGRPALPQGLLLLLTPPPLVALVPAPWAHPGSPEAVTLESPGSVMLWLCGPGQIITLSELLLNECMPTPVSGYHDDSKRYLQNSHHGSVVTNPTSIPKDMGSIPGPAQWVKDLALLWLWCRPAATAPIRPLAWEPS